MNFLKDEDHHHSWEKLGCAKTALLQSGRKILQKPGDHQDVIKMSTSWQSCPKCPMSWKSPRGRFFFSLWSVMCWLHSKTVVLLIKPDYKVVVGYCLRRGRGRTAITLPWSSPQGRRLLLRLDLRRNLRGLLRKNLLISLAGVLKMPWEEAKAKWILFKLLLSLDSISLQSQEAMKPPHSWAELQKIKL